MQVCTSVGVDVCLGCELCGRRSRRAEVVLGQRVSVRVAHECGAEVGQVAHNSQVSQGLRAVFLRYVLFGGCTSFVCNWSKVDVPLS